MMKKFMILPLLFGLFFTVSCNNSATEAETTDEVTTTETNTNATEFKVDTEKSELHWKGTKATGSHEGTIKIKSGTIRIEDKKITGANVIFDMNGIYNIDLTDEEYNTKLVNHLKSADFFDTENYPEAEFEFTSIETKENITTAYGNLTIKGITKNIGFPVDVNVLENELNIKSEVFTIDRTEWDVKYRSGKFFDDLKDKLINDEIELSFVLEGVK